MLAPKRKPGCPGELAGIGHHAYNLISSATDHPGLAVIQEEQGRDVLGILSKHGAGPDSRSSEGRLISSPGGQVGLECDGIQPGILRSPSIEGLTISLAHIANFC